MAIVYNTALFIDLENLFGGYHIDKFSTDRLSISSLMASVHRCQYVGAIGIRRAYANWNDQRLIDLHQELFNFGIEPVQTHSLSLPVGKDLADIHLVVDAMDALHTRSDLTTFVIVTGDGSFSPLATKLRSAGKTVVGFGFRENTSRAFVNVCEQFIYLKSSKLDEKTGLGNLSLSKAPSSTSGLPSKKADRFAQGSAAGTTNSAVVGSSTNGVENGAPHFSFSIPLQIDAGIKFPGAPDHQAQITRQDGVFEGGNTGTGTKIIPEPMRETTRTMECSDPAHSSVHRYGTNSPQVAPDETEERLEGNGQKSPSTTSESRSTVLEVPTSFLPWESNRTVDASPQNAIDDSLPCDSVSLDSASFDSVSFDDAFAHDASTLDSCQNISSNGDGETSVSIAFDSATKTKSSKDEKAKPNKWQGRYGVVSHPALIVALPKVLPLEAAVGYDGLVQYCRDVLVQLSSSPELRQKFQQGFSTSAIKEAFVALIPPTVITLVNEQPLAGFLREVCFDTHLAVTRDKKNNYVVSSKGFPKVPINKIVRDVAKPVDHSAGTYKNILQASLDVSELPSWEVFEIVTQTLVTQEPHRPFSCDSLSEWVARQRKEPITSSDVQFIVAVMSHLNLCVRLPYTTDRGCPLYVVHRSQPSIERVQSELTAFFGKHVSAILPECRTSLVLTALKRSK